MKNGEIGNYNHSEFLQKIESSKFIHLNFIFSYLLNNLDLMQIDKGDQVVYCEGHNESSNLIK